MKKRFVPAEAIDIFEAGGTPADVVEARVPGVSGEPVSARTARRWRHYWQEGVASPVVELTPNGANISTDDMQAIFRLLKNRSMSVEELSTELDRSTATILDIVKRMEEAGFNIRTTNQRVEASTQASLKMPEPPEILFDAQHIRFGIYADLHKGSKEEQITAFRHWLKYAREEGIEVFFGLGDYTAGRGVYRGQDLDLYLFTAEEQLEALRQDLQPLPNETHILLGGNHDFAHLKNGNTDVVARFCAEHSNVYFAGYDLADIPLTPNTGIRLWHPSGGKPYASCLSEDSEILTRRGWIGILEITARDEVATLNRATGELEFQRPQSIFIEPYYGYMIQIKDDLVDHMVTPQHDLWTRPPERGDWRKMPAGVFWENYEPGWQVSFTAGWAGVEQDDIILETGVSMPMDDFLMCLGQYMRNPQDMDLIRACGDLQNWLPIEAEWRVPRFVMELSARQIGIFLESLLQGSSSYHSENRLLLDDLQELILRSGHSAIIEGDTLRLVDQSYSILSEPPERVLYEGLIWCVGVMNGLIYARRNGKAVWTGNSYRLQKGMEAMAYEQLLRLSREVLEENPIVKVIAAGHLHIDAKVHEGAILGLQCACFEGQTNYLKRKGLYPQIGGYIVDLWLDDRGNIMRERIELTKYTPIEEDYRQYPERMERVYPPDKIVPVFSLDRDD